MRGAVGFSPTGGSPGVLHTLAGAPGHHPGEAGPRRLVSAATTPVKAMMQPNASQKGNSRASPTVAIMLECWDPDSQGVHASWMPGDIMMLAMAPAALPLAPDVPAAPGGLAFLSDIERRLAPCFERAEPRQRVMASLRGLLSPAERTHSWPLADVS